MFTVWFLTIFCISKVSVFFFSNYESYNLYFPITLLSNKCTNLRSYKDKELMYKPNFNNKN